MQHTGDTSMATLLCAPRRLRWSASLLEHARKSKVRMSIFPRFIQARAPADPWAMLEAETSEKQRLAEINVTLQRQLAAAKTLISLMDLDLTAKIKEVTSKDFLLAAEHSHALKLTAKLKELAELCTDNGLTVDLELTALARPSSRPAGEGRGIAAMLRVPELGDKHDND